eukprot:8070909-Karenia_brevis.AAC.1
MSQSLQQANSLAATSSCQGFRKSACAWSCSSSVRQRETAAVAFFSRSLASSMVKASSWRRAN